MDALRGKSSLFHRWRITELTVRWFKVALVLWAASFAPDQLEGYRTQVFCRDTLWHPATRIPGHGSRHKPSLPMYRDILVSHCLYSGIDSL